MNIRYANGGSDETESSVLKALLKIFGPCGPKRSCDVITEDNVVLLSWNPKQGSKSGVGG